MIKRTLSIALFLAIILGVLYIVVRAVQEDRGGATEQSAQSLGVIDSLKEHGLSSLDVEYPDGSAFDLSTIKAPVVIINFWASWCAPCVEEIPSFISLVEAYNGQITLLAVSLDTDKKQMEDFLRGFSVENPNIHILLDHDFEVAQKMGTLKLPESYILGADRKLLKKVSGSIDWISKDSQSYFNNILTRK